MNKWIVYTDGSYKNSINTGGYSCIITKNNIIKKILYEGFLNTTNNRMELRGVLEALKWIKEPSDVTIVTDSQYIVYNYTSGSVHKWFETNDLTKKNLDLWFEILDLCEKHNVTFQWVKGHNNHELNELADLYAQHAATCLNLKTDQNV